MSSLCNCLDGWCDRILILEKITDLCQNLTKFTALSIYCKVWKEDGTDLNEVNWKVRVSSVKSTSNYIKICNVYLYLRVIIILLNHIQFISMMFFSLVLLACSGNVHIRMHVFYSVWCQMIVLLNVFHNHSKTSYVCRCTESLQIRPSPFIAINLHSVLAIIQSSELK